MKTRLNKAEVEQIQRLADRLWKIRNKYQDNDIELQVEGNGTVRSNLDCAVAYLDTILQEY